MHSNSDKKSLQLLNGRVPIFEITLFCYMIFLIGATTIIVYIALSMTTPDRIVVWILIGFMFLLILYFAILLIKHFMLSAQLKEQFKQLPGSRQKQLLSLASAYKGSMGIKADNDYLYGYMSMFRSPRLKIFSLLYFRYLRYSDLEWVYLVQTSYAMSNQYGSPSVIYDPKQDRLRIHDVNGNIYNIPIRKSDPAHIFEMISQRNKHCKLGYKK